MLLNYIGGAQDTGIKDLSPDQIVDQVHEDVKKILLKPDAEKPRVLGLKVWPKAIPQYNKGHLAIIDKVEKATDSKTRAVPRGNYRIGVPSEIVWPTGRRWPRRCATTWPLRVSRLMLLPLPWPPPHSDGSDQEERGMKSRGAGLWPFACNLLQIHVNN